MNRIPSPSIALWIQRLHHRFPRASIVRFPAEYMNFLSIPLLDAVQPLSVRSSSPRLSIHYSKHHLFHQSIVLHPAYVFKQVLLSFHDLLFHVLPASHSSFVPILIPRFFCGTSFQTFVKTLGVTFDSMLTFQPHITNLCKSSFYHIRAIRHIRSALTNICRKPYVASSFV